MKSAFLGFTVIAFVPGCDDEPPLRQPTWDIEYAQLTGPVYAVSSPGRQWSLLDAAGNLAMLDIDTGAITEPKGIAGLDPTKDRVRHVLFRDPTAVVALTCQGASAEPSSCTLWDIDVAQGSAKARLSHPQWFEVLTVLDGRSVAIGLSQPGASELQVVDQGGKTVASHLFSSGRVIEACEQDGTKRLAVAWDSNDHCNLSMLRQDGQLDWHSSASQCLSGPIRCLQGGDVLAVVDDEWVFRISGTDGSLVSSLPLAPLISPWFSYPVQWSAASDGSLAVLVQNFDLDGPRITGVGPWGAVAFSRIVSAKKNEYVDRVRFHPIGEKGWLIAGGRGNGGAHGWVMRTDAWGRIGDESSCVSTPRSACDDGNPCTADDCQPATGCAHWSVPDGAPCGPSLARCYGGSCVVPK